MLPKHPIIANTATAVALAAARHSPPPQPQSLRGFIVVVVIVVIIVTAITTVFPPLSCDLFDCCVFVCDRVFSPSSSGGGHPAHRICHSHRRRRRGCRRCRCRRLHRPPHRHHRHCHHHRLPPLSCDLFECCVLVYHRVLSPSSSGGGHPAHRIRHRRCRRGHRRRRHRRLRHHLTPPPHNLFDCCLCVLVPRRVVSP